MRRRGLLVAFGLCARLGGAAARLAARRLILLALTLLAGTTSEAQGLEWERLGEFEFAHALVFYPGAAPDGSLDTMLVRADTEPDSIGQEDNDFFRRALTDTTWVASDRRIVGLGRDGAVALPSGCALFGNRSGPKGIERTCDGGRTWEEIFWPDEEKIQVNCLFLRSSDGELVGCGADPADLIVSADEGRTWTPVGTTFPGENADWALDLAEHPSASPAGGPRLAVAIQGHGWAYSDDGGLTLTPSDAWQVGRYLPDDLVLDPLDGTPLDGRLYATTNDGLSPDPRLGEALLASDDGGATWTTLAYFPTGSAQVTVTGDGAVWVGTSEQAENGRGRIWRSGDGGRTWEDVTGTYGGRPIGGDIVEGPDGRVYVAGGGSRAGTPRPNGGLWRTVDPVYAVASEPDVSPEAGGLTLTVRPNPAASSASVTVRLGAGAPPTEAVLTVHDVRGREVARLGGAVAGERTFRLGVGGWAAGVYVVRVETDTEAATAALTVAR